MPGKHEPADLGEMDKSVKDVNPNQAGIQSKSQTARFQGGEAPAENAYVEKQHKDRQ